MNAGVEIYQIRSQIKQIGSVLVNWGSKYKNLEPEYQNKRGVSSAYNRLYFYTIRYKPCIKTPDFLQKISKKNFKTFKLIFLLRKKNVLLHMVNS